MPLRHSLKTVRDFEIHTLANEALSISIAPELGGRIVSLKDKVSGREWCDGWSPAGKRRIWHPTDPADFSSGPGAGIDECLPTVVPCKVGRRHLPDHGELWNLRPEFDLLEAAAGAFTCRWNLKSLPLAFERRISVQKRGVRLDYRLENRSENPTPFLWAWHPLFTWKPGDEIRLPRNITTCLNSEINETQPWPITASGCDLSRARFAKGATPAAKVFLGPLIKGQAEIRAKNGARLSLAWPAGLFPYAGIWITRGAWKGLHHWAVEPTNAPVNGLSDILKPDANTLLQAREVRNWTLDLRF